MDSEEFIRNIFEVVRDASINDTVLHMVKVPGRNPRKEDLELSQWYKTLSQEERSNICKVITKAVDGSIFGLFCVIDGVRAIDDRGDGLFEFVFKNGTEEVLLNDPRNEYLHDIYNAMKNNTEKL